MTKYLRAKLAVFSFVLLLPYYASAKILMPVQGRNLTDTILLALAGLLAFLLEIDFYKKCWQVKWGKGFLIVLRNYAVFFAIIVACLALWIYVSRPGMEMGFYIILLLCLAFKMFISVRKMPKNVRPRDRVVYILLALLSIPVLCLFI